MKRLLPAVLIAVGVALSGAAPAAASYVSVDDSVPLHVSPACGAFQAVRAAIRPGAVGVRELSGPAVGDAATAPGGTVVARVASVANDLAAPYPGIVVTVVGTEGACTGQATSGGDLTAVHLRYGTPVQRLTAGGRVGALRLGHSTAADVERIEGPPTVVQAHPDRILHPGSALLYDWGDNATPTFFFISAKTHRLSDVYTSSPEYRTPRGTSTLTVLNAAARREHTSVQPIVTPDNCSDETVVVAPKGNVTRALRYASTFDAFLFSRSYLQNASLTGVSPTADTRLLISGPGSLFARGKRASKSVRPVCYISRRRHGRR